MSSEDNKQSRKLPDWMTSTTEDEAEDKAKSSSSSSSGGGGRKYHYIMSPAELEATAREVLRKKSDEKGDKK